MLDDSLLTCVESPNFDCESASGAGVDEVEAPLFTVLPPFLGLEVLSREWEIRVGALDPRQRDRHRLELDIDLVEGPRSV